MIGKLLLIYRHKYELGVREMAKVIGVSAATISRLEAGKEMDAKTQLKLINWLFGSLP